MNDSNSRQDDCTCVPPGVEEEIKATLPNEELIFASADFFKVFGDSTRLKILYTLLEKEMCVGALVRVLDMNQSAVSHQLRVLRQNGLVRYRKDGKEVFYALDDGHVEMLLKQGLEHVSHKIHLSFE